MSPLRPAGVVILVVLLQTSPSRAEGYPYSGTFTTAGNPKGPEEDDIARCALNFFTQEESGAFVNYVPDMEKFYEEGTLRYLVTTKGHCTFDKRHKLEVCTTTFYLDPSAIGTSFPDVIDQITSDFIKVTSFATEEEAKSYYATGKAEGGFQTSYARCPFDPAKLSAALSTDVARLSTVDAQKLMSPDVELLHAPITVDLVKAAGLAKP
jgi:hypothetical protein